MLKLSPAKFFVYCALIFGILLITIIPPFQSPDEDSHFKRAYVVSRGQFYPTSRDGVVGYEIPNEMNKYIHEKLTYIGNRDRKYSYSEEILDDRVPVDYSEVTFQNFSTAEANPIAYLAPATGIVFAKITTKIIGMSNISVAMMLQFARFFSLLLYIVLVYFAIKITPILKKTFCVIGLLPMSLALAAAISYDSVITALVLLCTAIIFKLLFDKDVKTVPRKYLVILGVILFVLLTVKTIYVTALIPLIFVPKEKWGGKIRHVIKCFSIIIGIAGILYIINKIPLLGLQRNVVQNNSGEQLQYVIHNPLTYAKILLKTMWTGRNFYFSGIIGTFGLIDTYIPTVYIIMYAIGVLAVAVSDFSLCTEKFSWKYKCVSTLAGIATVGAVFTGMYILWTGMELGVGAETITGVQGRYFIPVIPLIMVLLSNKLLKKSEKIQNIMEKILNNSYFVPSMMLSISLVTIFLRYWC